MMKSKKLTSAESILEKSFQNTVSPDSFFQKKGARYRANVSLERKHAPINLPINSYSSKSSHEGFTVNVSRNVFESDRENWFGERIKKGKGT